MLMIFFLRKKFFRRQNATWELYFGGKIFIFLKILMFFFFVIFNILRSKVQDDAMSAAEIFWGVSKMSKKVSFE